MSESDKRIAELRRRIQADKGKVKRAEATMGDLSIKKRRAENRIYFDQKEIEELGGKVRR